MSTLWDVAGIAWRALGRREDIQAILARAKPFYVPLVAAYRALVAAQKQDPKFIDDATALYEDIMGAAAPGTADVAPNVQWIQQSMNTMVGTHLAVDGKKGPETDAAVELYQKRKGMTVDGWVGPQTFAAITADLKAKVSR